MRGRGVRVRELLVRTRLLFFQSKIIESQYRQRYRSLLPLSKLIVMLTSPSPSDVPLSDQGMGLSLASALESLKVDRSEVDREYRA